MTKLAQFLVDEFLRSDESNKYTLTFQEVAILMALANHVRNAADCYPSQSYLAQYLRTSDDTINRYLKSLQRKKLIKTFRKPSKNKRYKTSRHNYYALTLPVDNFVITRTERDITQENEVRSPAESGTSQCDHPHTAVRIPADSGTNRTVNRTIKEKESRATPSDFVFEPDEANLLYAKDIGVDVDENIRTFIEKYRYPKTQAAFKDWLIINQRHLMRKAAESASSQSKIETSSPVNRMPFYESDRKLDAIKRDITPEPVIIEKLPSFKEQLKIYKQQQGSKPNGKDHSTDTTGNHRR